MDYIWAEKLPVNTIFYKLYNKHSSVQRGISFTIVAKLGLRLFLLFRWQPWRVFEWNYVLANALDFTRKFGSIVLL